MDKELTCPFEPYAVYSKFPFSSFPPHLRIAEARKVDFRALCAALNEANWVRSSQIPNANKSICRLSQTLLSATEAK